MKASATIAVGRCGDRSVVVDQRSAAPFSVRQCGQRILLVSSAAAPVGGDELSLSIDLGSGAKADVGSVAASMVWPGSSDSWSSMTTACRVGEGAHLSLWLEPTISVAGSRHRSETDRAASWLPVATDAAVVMAVGHDRPRVMDLLANLSPELS